MSADPVRDWPLSLGLENASARAPDGTRIRVVMGGPPEGRRVVLLHGAPQFSYAFRRVIPRLTGRYRVIAPDLRGFGDSEIARSGRYDLDSLVDDLGAVLDRASGPGLSAGPAILVGHDWGGPVVWRFAEKYPLEVRHLVSVNGPHPAAFAREIFKPAQARRSWYMAVFMLPGAGRILEIMRASPLVRAMRRTSAPGAFSDEDLEVYRAALCRPRRIDAMLAVYREGARFYRTHRDELLGPYPRLEVPATVVWGEADTALAPSHPDAIRPFVARLEIRRLPGASHWVPEERPDDVANAILDGDRAG
jgi:pimeloyl-ACP methyl ester carboxylesterase